MKVIRPNYQYLFNHYNYLEKHLPKFFEDMSVKGGWKWNVGIIGAHGDKFYGYKDMWGKEGIHFFHGCLIMMLTYVLPFSKESRETNFGWVDPAQWVIQNYSRFKDQLPPIEN
jgi:hypothetical protein